VLVLAFGAAYAAALLPFFAFGRFRLPLIPWLALLGGAALSHPVRALRERHWKGTAGAVALLLAGLAGQRAFGLDPPRSPFYENIFLLHVAEQRGNFSGMEQAARALLKELEARPEGFGRRRGSLRADAHLALGRAWIQTGREREGLEALRRSYSGAPRPDVAAAIAGLEARHLGAATAERTLAEAVEAFPARAELRLQWAALLAARGSRSQAEAQLMAAARVARWDPAVQFEVARQLSEIGGPAAAASAALARFLLLRPEERGSPAVVSLRARLLGTAKP